MQHINLDWATVDREAQALGAQGPARRKWRQPGRRVPFEWQIKIIERLASRGFVATSAQFDALPSNPGSIAT